MSRERQSEVADVPDAEASRAILLVNGEPQALPADTSVRDLIAHLGFDGRRIAVAVNREVVPRSAYASRRLEAGDRVEILEAVGGG